MINAFDMVNLTKLDVLDEEQEIPVLEENGSWKTFPGWKTSTVGITECSTLPKKAQNYIDWIERAAGVPVRLIGTGPGREQMIIR
jgi:adenylosuccinate synthase